MVDEIFVYLDSSFLAAYTIKNHQFEKQSLKLMEDFITQDLYLGLSSLALDELWYIYGRSIEPNEPWASKSDLIGSITLKLLEVPHLHILYSQDENAYILAALKNIKKHNLKPRDAFHLSMMQQWEIERIATFDQHFKNIKKLTIYP